MVGLDIDGLAAAWIADCAANHRLCPEPKDAELPTRLLDIGSPEDNPETLHLIETERGAKGKWVALSYSWGNANKYTTTTANLQDNLREIVFEELPLTIRDAITITRGLGIRYLWVDALCIIQDSHEDWQKEAGQMMNVYRNSYVTIAANEGEDAESGLCLQRNILESRPCELKFHTEEAKQAARYHWIHPPRIPWRNIVKKAHLQTRGWTLQETTLSTRVIYYGEEGICWQCREGIRQERVPAYLITANDPLVPRRIFDAYVGDPMNIFALWCDLVEEYTSRHLTRETDKLPAISGLASALAAFIQSRSERRLASPEEKKYYYPPELVRHWAVPYNPLVQGTNRHDGGNLSLRDILTKDELTAGRTIYTHTRGPLSMDPFLSLRWMKELDKDADTELLFNRNPRTTEILEYVGLGKLLEFEKEKRSNPDYDHEFLLLMSHPDTHAAYFRAYYIWKDDREGKISFEAYKTNNPPNHNTEENTSEQASGEPDMTDPFWIKVSALDAGFQYGVPEEPEIQVPARANMYVYGPDSPIRARVEWPGYTMDDVYLAGLWKADLLNQLRWYCTKAGVRAEEYRAPSWSWASLDRARVAYKKVDGDYTRNEGVKGNDHEAAKLIRVDVEMAGDNRFGDLKDGRLTLLAGIRHMPPLLDFEENVSGRIRELHVNDGEEEDKSKLAPVERSLTLDRENLCLDEEGRQPDPSLKLVRLVKNWWLIVELVTDAEGIEAFKRVGCWDRSMGRSANGPSGTLMELEDWDVKEIVLV